jgi:hypothetical protein
LTDIVVDLEVSGILTEAIGYVLAALVDAPRFEEILKTPRTIFQKLPSVAIPNSSVVFDLLKVSTNFFLTDENIDGVLIILLYDSL